MRELFNYIKQKSVRGNISASIKELSVATGFTNKEIKIRLRKLIDGGYVNKIINTDSSGANIKNTYKIVKNIEEDRTIDHTKVIYIKNVYIGFVNARIGSNKNTFSPLNFSNKSINSSIRILELCNKYDFNIVKYISACFHTFTKEWCMKTFKIEYPPIYILTSLKHAEERYESFERHLMQFYEHKENESTTDIWDKHIYVWSKLGRPTDINLLNMLIENSTLPVYFVASVLDNLPYNWKYKNDIDVKLVKEIKNYLRSSKDGISTINI